MSTSRKMTALLVALLMVLPAVPAVAQDSGTTGELTPEEQALFLGEPIEGEEPDESIIEVTDYESCMDKAEQMLLDCSSAGGGELMIAFCISRFGYQKLWCTIRYVSDIVF